jgi:hypothetical protein
MGIFFNSAAVKDIYYNGGIFEFRTGQTLLIVCMPGLLPRFLARILHQPSRLSTHFLGCLGLFVYLHHYIPAYPFF